MDSETIQLIKFYSEIAIAVIIVIVAIVMCIKNRWFSKLYTCLKESIREAEQNFGSGEGEKKKAYVLQKMKEKCAELGIPYEFIYKRLSSAIESIISHYNIIVKDDKKDD